MLGHKNMVSGITQNLIYIMALPLKNCMTVLRAVIAKAQGT